MDPRGISTDKTPDWRWRAACAGLGDEMFPDPRDAEGNKRAQQVCLLCPVRAECLDDALGEERGRVKDNRFGVRGGLTASQRHRMYLSRLLEARTTA
ncbi:WhiB family transcriptional regulator [Streptomyces sp. NPDC057217]|uniref:WhiB family transcriptional regulator n=1 Tax=Streptomyces sp. NPDC057217 TaxID=3346054 RepID=UPI00363CE8A4